MELDGRAPRVRFIVRDRDTKFCGPFDTGLRSEGAGHPHALRST